jgi:hypothetical protein
MILTAPIVLRVGSYGTAGAYPLNVSSPGWRPAEVSSPPAGPGRTAGELERYLRARLREEDSWASMKISRE